MAHHVRFKPFLDYSVFLLARLVEEFLNILPERAAAATGRFLGRMVYVLLADRRAAAMENLTIAFGKERSNKWIRRTAARSFEHLGLLGVEFFRIRRWSQREMAERITIRGKLPYDLAMLPGNDGIVLLNSHFGCFEVSAATIKFLGVRLNLIATGLKNRFLTRYFFSRGGKGTGVKTYPHKGIVKQMIGLLEGGHMVAFLADQRGDAERGVIVNYFDSPAPANEVFARIAIEGRGRVLPLCTYRLDDGRYESVFEEEIRINLTGDRQQDLITVSQQFHDLFEKWLRMRPEQGFWVQRKWKRKPSRRRSKGSSR